MRLIDAEPIEQALFRWADKSLAKNPYENAKICAFRRAFELILDAPTIASPPNDTPPNDPLTLEELLEMDEEPVWVTLKQEGTISVCGRALVEVNLEGVAGTNFRLNFEDYGEGGWLAYRSKPEEAAP